MNDAARDITLEVHITALLQTLPQTQTSPQFANDLALAFRGLEYTRHPPTTLSTLIQALWASVDPPRAINHLLRYLDNLEDSTAFWTACLQHPQGWKSLVNIFAASHFLSSLLWRRPRWLFWLLEEGLRHPQPATPTLREQLEQHLDGTTSDIEVAGIIRAFTYQHLLALGARDLSHLADVEETTAGLTALAECVLQVGLDHCEARLQAVHGIPMYTDDTGAQHRSHFCVIGMGKLGGGELNFSSDIDLMYVYTSYQGQTSGVMHHGTLQGQISNHEYFVALARRLTTLVGGKGPDGQAFRVDLRLRPEGTQGQLALSLLSYEAYYARLGQTWEKMALLKARPVAGDAQLGSEFLALIRPFVYERHLDYTGVQQLREIKKQIDAQMLDKDQEYTNVKLGSGGIREIEFLIQLPQLLYGGRQPVLQERHSLRALTVLRQTGHMTPQVEATLRHTYGYLRRLEHFLQMEQGAQTHTLPQREEQRLRLARHFGFMTWEAFYHDYRDRTAVIHALFVEVFAAAAEEQ